MLEPQDEEDIMEMQRRGYSVKYISEYVGCTTCTVYRVFRRNGIQSHLATQRFWTDELNNKLVEMYKSGAPTWKMAKELGRTINGVSNQVHVLIRAGVITNRIMDGRGRAQHGMLQKLEPGTRFGRLTVIEDRYKGSTEDVLVRCDCGTECVKSRISVRHGHTRSCGCLQHESMKTIRPRILIDYQGKKCSMKELSALTGISLQTLYTRYYNFPIEHLLLPVRKEKCRTNTTSS